MLLVPTMGRKAYLLTLLGAIVVQINTQMQITNTILHNSLASYVLMGSEKGVNMRGFS